MCVCVCVFVERCIYYWGLIRIIVWISCAALKGPFCIRWDEFDEVHWEGHLDALDTGGRGAAECIGRLCTAVYTIPIF